MTINHSQRRPTYRSVEDDLSIVYPDSDGEPVAENDHQLTAMLDAISTLRAWFADRETSTRAAICSCTTA